MSLADDLLMPDGHPVGTADGRASVRSLPGDRQTARELFEALTVGGSPVVHPWYPGRLIDLPGGGRIGLRRASKNGSPTIDVDVPGLPVDKVKFN